MASNMISIAIGMDRANWHTGFASALDKKIEAGLSCSYSCINMEANNWLEKILEHDFLIWKPAFMGVKSASHVKEKIYFLQYIAKKLVIPNYETIWHFESKIAQSYIFSYLGIKTPKTVATFDYHDAKHLLDLAKMPVVIKSSNGAASNAVSLEKSKDHLATRLENTFNEQLWFESNQKPKGPKWLFYLRNLSNRWGKARLIQTILDNKDEMGGIYWQDFIEGNSADLRITVIGDRYAVGFWRNNRPNDFRASGSGRIDYSKPIPEEVIRYCLQISRNQNFDSMCYDILFTSDSFVINEMSYAFVDKAVFNANGYYFLDPENQLAFINRHTWPQELWVDWALQRAKPLFSEKDLK
jgi:glutathione synthase/RimK-type ligase-like ATP-grasp enzyme